MHDSTTREDAIDEALEETFPASDPISLDPRDGQAVERPDILERSSVARDSQNDAQRVAILSSEVRDTVQAV